MNDHNEIYQKLEKDERKFIKILIIKMIVIMSSISIFSYFIILTFTQNFGVVFLIIFFSAVIFPFLIIQYYKGKKTLKKNISTEKNFEVLDYKKIVFRYRYTLNLISQYRNYFLISIGIATFFLLIGIPDFTQEQLVYSNQIVVIATTVVGSIWFGIALFKWSFSDRDDFEYYLTSGIFKLITNYTLIDELEKTRLAIFGIDSYENYIRDELRLHFANKEILYSKIIGSTPAIMDSEVGQIMVNLQKNKLSLLRYFETYLDKSGTSVLNRIIISQKIKDYLPLVSIAPLIVLIVNFIK